MLDFAFSELGDDVCANFVVGLDQVFDFTKLVVLLDFFKQLLRIILTLLIPTLIIGHLLLNDLIHLPHRRKLQLLPQQITLIKLNPPLLEPHLHPLRLHTVKHLTIIVIVMRKRTPQVKRSVQYNKCRPLIPEFLVWLEFLHDFVKMEGHPGGIGGAPLDSDVGVFEEN